MKITLESTTEVVMVSPAEGGYTVPARRWEGHTDTGIPVFALITRIAVGPDPRPEDLAQFEAELEACRPPSADQVWPSRMIL